MTRVVLMSGVGHEPRRPVDLQALQRRGSLATQPFLREQALQVRQERVSNRPHRPDCAARLGLPLLLLFLFLDPCFTIMALLLWFKWRCYGSATAVYYSGTGSAWLLGVLRFGRGIRGID